MERWQAFFETALTQKGLVCYILKQNFYRREEKMQCDEDWKEVLIKKPEAKDLKPWQFVRELGWACKVHSTEYASIDNRKICSNSELWEKKDCRFVQLYQIKCRWCDEDNLHVPSGEDCNKHKLVLITKDVACYIANGYGKYDYSTYLFVANRHSTRGFARFHVNSYKSNWLKKMLNYIKTESGKNNGFEKLRQLSD